MKFYAVYGAEEYNHADVITICRPESAEEAGILSALAWAICRLIIPEDIEDYHPIIEVNEHSGAVTFQETTSHDTPVVRIGYIAHVKPFTNSHWAVLALYDHDGILTIPDHDLTKRNVDVAIQWAMKQYEAQKEIGGGL